MYGRYFKFVLSILVGAILMLSALPALAQTAADVEFIGEITELTDTSITVNGQVIDVTTAEISVILEVGAVVKVEGTLNPDGTIVAREVQAVDDSLLSNEAEIIGILESLDDTTAIINTFSFDVTTAEVQLGVAVGQLVKVHASYDAETGVWVARELELFVPDDDDVPPANGEFEFTGTLEDMGDGFIVVAGLTVDTTTAEVKGTLLVGAVVKVHASWVDGALVAREVENAAMTDDFGDDDQSDDNSGDELEFQGILEDMGDGFIVVAGQTFDISNAEIKNTLVIGDPVKVHASWVDGALVAREVENTAMDDDHGDDNDDDHQSATSGDLPISAEDAIARVLEIYPNTTITSIELKDRSGAYYWEIETSHDIELEIDAQTGVILRIDQDGGDDARFDDYDDDGSVDDSSGHDNRDDDRDDDHNDDRDDDDHDDDRNDDDHDDD